MIRTRQPQGIARIDPFFAIGLAELSYQRTSLLDGSAWTSFGTAPTYDVGPHGLRVNSMAAFGGLYRTPRINCSTAEQTHLFVGEVSAYFGGYAGLFGSGKGDGSAGSIGLQRNGANNGWAIFNNSNYSELTGDLIGGAGLVSIVMSSSGGNTAIFVNGVPWRLDALAPTTQTTSRIAVFGERSSSASYAIKGVCYLRGAWARGMSQTEAKELSLNPWQLFAPDVRRIYFGTGGGATAYALDAQPGGYSVNGTAATLARGLFINAAPATYAISGTAASVVRGYNLNAAAGTFTASGTVAGLLRALSVNAGPGTFNLSGTAAGLDKTTAGAFSIDAQPGTYSLTGIAATLSKTTLTQYTLNAQPGTYSLNGAAATLVYTPLNAYTLNAQPGTYTITGTVADLFYSGSSIWTDVGVSAATWSDVGTSTSIWTDL
jgi:hypothetical protein